MATIQSVRGRRSSISQTSRRTRDAQRPSTDWLFITTVLVLVVLGLVMAYSTTFYWSATSEGSPFAIFGKQLLYAAGGLILFVALSRIDYGIWRRLALPLISLAVLSLAVVLLWGDTVFHARRTLFNGSFQPSEPAKIFILLYGAVWLASRREQVTSLKYGLAPFALIVGVVAGLIAAQPDLSTSIIILIAASAMFFMAGASVVQIAVAGGISVGAFVVLVNALPHAMDRLQQFLNAIGNPQDTHYHIQQSLLAIGGGGVFGSGIGASYQKYGYLPTPHTDSVFAVLAEEMGLLGVIVTLGLFALLAYRSLRIAHKAGNIFGSFWAVGLVTWIMMQALLNLMAMTGLLPLPGVPVPFLSVGGSSLVSVLAACGILVSISRGSKMLAGDGSAGNEEGGEPFGGRPSYSATSNIRRRNSRPRPARTNRSEGGGDDAGTDIIGRDVKFGARLGGRAAGTPFGNAGAGALRWRVGRNGTGARLPRGR